MPARNIIPEPEILQLSSIWRNLTYRILQIRKDLYKYLLNMVIEILRNKTLDKQHHGISKLKMHQSDIHSIANSILEGGGPDHNIRTEQIQL